jgi:hypothetical protein
MAEQVYLVQNPGCQVPPPIVITINLDDLNMEDSFQISSNPDELNIEDPFQILSNPDELDIEDSFQIRSNPDNLVKTFNNMKMQVLHMTFYYLQGICYSKSDIILRMVHLHDIIKVYQCKNHANWLMNQTSLIYGIQLNWQTDLPCDCDLCKII